MKAISFRSLIIGLCVTAIVLEGCRSTPKDSQTANTTFLKGFFFDCDCDTNLTAFQTNLANASYIGQVKIERRVDGIRPASF